MMKDISDPKKILSNALSEGRKVLLEHEAKELCLHYGMPVAKSYLARSKEEAIEVAEKIGYPIVLKIVSPDVLHKSDIGGVVLNIKSKEELVSAYDNIITRVKTHNPKAKIHGILVQEMVPQGLEIIVGAVKDAFFGHAIMFGLGGIFVEVLKDVSFRVVPVTREDVLEMMKEIKGYQLLKGYRGQPPRDEEAIVDIILKLSRMLEELQEIKELDLNPIMVYEVGKGAKIVDARIILEA